MSASSISTPAQSLRAWVVPSKLLGRRSLLVCLALAFTLLILHSLLSDTRSDLQAFGNARPSFSFLRSFSRTPGQYRLPSRPARRRRIGDALYSGHNCVGTAQGGTELDGTRCHFQNVCLKLNVPFPAEPQRYPKPGTHLPSSVSLQYYRPPAARRSPLTWNDNAHEDRPWVRVARDSYATPEVRYEALPDGAWWADAETGVLQEAFWPENFGHSMGDDFLPIFRLASSFGLWDRSTVQAIMHPPCWSRGYWERGCAHHDELAPLLLDRPYETYNGTLFSSVSPDDQSSGHVCFQHLLVGTARLGMGYPSEHLWPRFLAELKRGANLSPTLGPKKQRITILVKHGRRTILNYAEVEHGLRSRFGVEVEAVDPAEMGLVEQLRYMQETTVVVSPCGGVSFSAIFLPKGASPVFVDYWDVRYNTTSQMERFIYTSNDNITPFYYPVEFDDLSIDRTQIPGWFREHEAEWEIWRNWANVTINVERMERYVLSALLQAEVSFGWQKSFRLEP